ncbi:MAG: PA2778 family cysteine peptidase [Pseudomonadales bacterium]
MIRHAAACTATATRPAGAVAWLVLVLLGGCAGLGAPPPPLATAPVELTETPFHPQEDYLCGPAALATVLNHGGVAVTPEALIDSLYLPVRRGTLQVELAATARRHGRLAVQLDDTLEAVIAQLEQGRPVLVLQNLASSLVPVWHYAVVVGYLPDADRFVLRSGRERRLLTRRSRFAATWERAGRWALVLADPAQVPQRLPRQNYLRAAADLENTGRHRQALTAFRSALGAWPDDPTARLGEANNLYYLGEHAAAAEAYRALVADHPGHPVAVHNLAMVLLEQDRPCEARAVIDAAADLDGDLIATARRAVGAAPRDGCPSAP